MSSARPGEGQDWPASWPSGAGGPPSAAPSSDRRAFMPAWEPVSAGGGPGVAAGPGAPVIPAKAAWWGLVGFAAAEVLATVGAVIGYALTGNQNSSVVVLLSEPGLWAGMFFTALLVSRYYGSGSLRRDFGLEAKPADLLRGIGAFVVVFVVASGVLEAFSGTRFAGSNTAILTDQKGNGVAYVLISVMVAIGAPFFEELFFRGFLRTALKTRFGTHGAVLGQAFFFALAHLGEVNGWGNVSVVTAIFCFGVVLGYTAALTGRLAPGMVAHCLFNLVAVITVA